MKPTNICDAIVYVGDAIREFGQTNRRDRLAEVAMRSLLSASPTLPTPLQLVEWCYQYADAMLAARSKP